ncbi:MAG: hypothetical protein QOI20_3345 [Acidimicrobiaceae bacterium]|nr:hypothetical protein [Acidimicrobiaceae bacterium]
MALRGWICAVGVVVALGCLTSVTLGAPVGSEFQVNTFTTNGQGAPEVAMDAAGNAVVVWQSLSQDGSGWGVYGQRYNAAGSPVGGEFQINTLTTGDQQRPDVAVASNGTFVVTWESTASAGSDISGWSVQARRFDSSGSPQGPEFQVNTFTASDQLASAVATTSGGYVVAWQSNQDGAGSGIYGQRYSAAGTPQGGEFQVNTTTAGDQTIPDVAADGAGDFVLTWASTVSSGPDTSGLSVQARRYDAAGTAQGPEFQVNTVTANSQDEPQVAAGGDGSFVIVWSSPNDGDQYGVAAQRYDAAGAPSGSEFQVNATTSGNQQSPEVAADTDGDFAVTWQSATSDGTDNSSNSVHTRRYARTGESQGGEYQVNTFTTGSQQLPAAGMDSDGAAMFVWQSDQQDGNSYGVFGQRDARLPQCGDAKDNDGDGAIDLADPGCSSGTDDSESPDPAKTATRLTATPAIAQVSGVKLYLFGLTATLTTASNSPLAGRSVSFRAGSTPLCTAKTGPNGVARCNALTKLLNVTLAQGYTASFAGDGSYAASSATAGLIEL